MIRFKGSQKKFFKAYPINQRSFDEIYCLTSYNLITNQETEQCYKFVGTLGEKNFKKVETPVEEPKPKEESGSETTSIYANIEARLSSLEDMISVLMAENARLNDELEHTRARLQEQLYDFGALCAVVYVMDEYLYKNNDCCSYDREKTFFDVATCAHAFHNMMQIPHDKTYMYMKRWFLEWLKSKGLFNEKNPFLNEKKGVTL